MTAPILAAASSTVITVTVGNNGASEYGFVVASYGSISPTLLYGSTINKCYHDGASNTIVEVAAVVSADFFNRVTFKYGASGATARNLVAASATFSSGGGVSRWTWAASATFTATDNGLARLVIFYR